MNSIYIFKCCVSVVYARQMATSNLSLKIWMCNLWVATRTQLLWFLPLLVAIKSPEDLKLQFSKIQIRFFLFHSICFLIYLIKIIKHFQFKNMQLALKLHNNIHIKYVKGEVFILLRFYLSQFTFSCMSNIRCSSSSRLRLFDQIIRLVINL